MILILFVLGLCLGSFLNAMVWRIHKRMDWVKGRSQCDHCGHKLSTLDLIPLFSWILLGGRCRYCKKRLSAQHPLVELGMGFVFVVSYLYWPGGLNEADDWLLFVTWLVSSVGLMSLLLYDLHWMILPNKIVYPVAAIAATGRLVYVLGFSPEKVHDLLMWGLSVAVASGVFWLLYEVSKGKWIGFGDVRLGLITGTLLADPAKSFLMLFIASLLGTIMVLPALITGKKDLEAKVPYGPFLITATAICILFGQSILDWYKALIGA